MQAGLIQAVANALVQLFLYGSQTPRHLALHAFVFLDQLAAALMGRLGNLVKNPVAALINGTATLPGLRKNLICLALCVVNDLPGDGLGRKQSLADFLFLLSDSR